MHIYLAYFLSVLFSSYLGQAIPSSECEAWYNMEQYVLKKSDILLCKTNDNCTGMNCTGKIQGEDFYTAIQINHCDSPASVKLFADLPQMGIRNWQKIFTQKATFDISGEVEGEFSMKRNSNTVVVGLKLKVLSSVQKYIPSLRGVPLEQQIFQDVVIPVPACQNDSSLYKNAVSDTSQVSSEVVMSSHVDLKSIPVPNGNCTIYNSSCAAEETCKQLNKSFEVGICICRFHYSRNSDGICVYTPDEFSTETPPDHGPLPNSEDNEETIILLKTVLLPVCVLLLLVGLIFILYRFQVFKTIHDRLRSRVYEDLLLGHPEDNDEPLTDPVA